MPSVGPGIGPPLLTVALYDTVTDAVGERNGDLATKLGRDEVVAAALELVVREGPAALTMRRLATELGVGTPTIYWHVGSRDELVTAIVQLQSERLADRPITGRDARRRVLAAARNMYAGALEERAITSLADRAGMSSLLLHDLQAALVGELEAAGLAGAALDEALQSLQV